jgi:hypothetical protein
MARNSIRAIQSRNRHTSSATILWDSFELPTGKEETRATSPDELFEECASKEQRTKKSNVVEVLNDLARFFLFNRPLFGESADWSRDEHPLFFTIRRSPGKTVRSDWRYTELLRHLKALNEPELRWVLIARWLKQEGICEPDSFLPASVLRRILKKTRAAKIRLSSTDVYLWRLVRIWLPYFEYLLADARRIPKSHRGPGEALVKLGYLKDAVKWSLEKRSAVQAVANWLEQRNMMNRSKQPSARTLENAYSRVLVAMRKANSDVEKFHRQRSGSKAR